MLTAGKTRYTKVVHDKYTLCAWRNKSATKHCTEIQQVMYKGESHYSKLVPEQRRFSVARHTCLLSRNSTRAHPKPPTSVWKKKEANEHSAWNCAVQEERKKSLTSCTRAPSLRVSAFHVQCSGSGSCSRLHCQTASVSILTFGTSQVHSS